MISLRKRVKITPEKALFFLTSNGTVVIPTLELSTLYNTFMDPEDGFLYIYVMCENSFG